VPIALGEGLFKPLKPPEPSAEEKLREELRLIREALTAQPTAVVSDGEAAVVPVLSADEMAKAVADAVSGSVSRTLGPLLERLVPEGNEELTQPLADVAKHLERMNRKVSALSAMPAVTAPPNVTIDGGTLDSIRQPVTFDPNTVMTTKVREHRLLLDYSTRLDSNPVYVGSAAPGSSETAAVWLVKRLGYDATARLIQVDVRDGIAWTDRAVGW
jgi:hypothetical protein